MAKISSDSAGNSYLWPRKIVPTCFNQRLAMWSLNLDNQPFGFKMAFDMAEFGHKTSTYSMTDGDFLIFVILTSL